MINSFKANHLGIQLTQRRVLKVFKIILGLFGLIVLLLIGLFLKAYYAKDLPDFTESRLSLQTISIVQNDNSYYDLAKLPENVSSNSPELIYFDQASEKNQFADPAIIDPNKMNMDSTYGVKLNIIRAGARAKIAQVDNLLSQGKNQEAFLEAEKIIKVGSTIANSQSPLIHYLAGVAVAKMGWQELDKIPVSDLSADLKKEHTAILAQYIDTRAGLKNALKFEYITSSNTFSSGDLQNLTDKYQTTFVPGQTKFLPNKTKKLLAEMYLDWIDKLNRGCPITFTETHYTPSKISIYFTENSVGRVVTDMISIALKTVPNKMCDLENIANNVLSKLK